MLRLLVIGVLFWGPLVLFVQLADEVREQTYFGYDVAILNAVHSQATPLRDTIMIVVSDLAGPELLGIGGVAAAGALYAMRHRRWAISLLAGVGGATAINMLLKVMFQRPRPLLWEPLVHESSYSFPSGHAMVSMALAATLVSWLWYTRWRYVAMAAGAAYVLTVGLSRVYLGVHYPTDIIAGWCVSLAWVIVVRMTMQHTSLAGWAGRKLRGLGL